MTSFATTSTGTRIAYFVSGREWRPSLVLTHSLGSDHNMWDPQIEALQDQYYIVAIDNLGHGESDAPVGDYTVTDLAAAVTAVADATELERFHYCGLSVGGITGVQLATHHADRLLCGLQRLRHELKHMEKVQPSAAEGAPRCISCL